MGVIKLIAVLIAAGTAYTGATAETVLASFDAPARTFTNGKVLRVRGSVRTTVQAAADTLNIRIRIGPTTLVGTAVFTSGAIAQVVGDTFVFDITLICRDADASGTLVVHGFATPPDATGTAVVSIAPVPLTALDFTAIQRIEVTGVWSAATASSCQAESFIVEEAA